MKYGYKNSTFLSQGWSLLLQAFLFAEREFIDWDLKEYFINT